jgi:Major Facilitator Superfamily
MVSKYRSVLSVPGATRLFASALVGRLPQGMSGLAILLLVRATTHSYAAAGVAVGAFALATAACAPLLGRLVDQFGRVRVLLPFACAQACVYGLLVIAAQAGAGVVVLIVLSGLAGALLPPIAPAVRALLREVFDVFDDQAVLDTAYALESIHERASALSSPELRALLGPVALAVDRRRRCLQPARRSRDRAGVLLPVRAGRPLRQAGQRDRGVHMGVGGADRRARRRLGDRRRGDRAWWRRRPIRAVVRGIAACGGDRGRLPQPRSATRLNSSLARNARRTRHSTP